MEYSGSLKERITCTLETLSPKHKHIARFVLDNYHFTSFASASQIGKKNDTSAARMQKRMSAEKPPASDSQQVFYTNINNSIVSPLSPMADIAFEIATEGVAHSLSITALLSLQNVFVSMLADRVAEQVYAALQRVDATYRNNDLLIMR